MKYGATGMQGWRNTMEDSHIADLDLGKGISFFGVYDGHGGKNHCIVKKRIKDYPNSLFFRE